jgi:uncharacterized protein YigE (DUF2233 family)
MPIVRRIVFLLAAVTSLAADNGAMADTGPCHSMEYERTAYIICEVDLRRHTVRLYWNRPDGTPYAYLSALPRDLEGTCARPQNEQFRACAAGSADSRVPSLPAKLPIISRMQAMREIDRNLL